MGFMKNNFSQESSSIEASISVSSKKEKKSTSVNNEDSTDLAKRVKLMNELIELSSDDDDIVIDLEIPIFLKKDAAEKETDNGVQQSNHSNSNKDRAQDSAPMDNLTVSKDDVVESDDELIHSLDKKSKSCRDENENDVPTEEEATLKKSSQSKIENKGSENVVHQETQHETDNDPQHTINNNSKDRTHDNAQMHNSMGTKTDCMQVDNSDTKSKACQNKAL